MSIAGSAKHGSSGGKALSLLDPLIKAIRDGDLLRFRSELASQGARKVYNLGGYKEGITALAYAIDVNRHRVVPELLRHGADPNVKIKGKPVLIEAMQQWSASALSSNIDAYLTVTDLVNAEGTDLNVSYDDLPALAHLPFSRVGAVEMFKNMIKRGANVHVSVRDALAKQCDLFSEILARNLWLYSVHGRAKFRELLDILAEQKYQFNQASIRWFLVTQMPSGARTEKEIEDDVRAAEEHAKRVRQSE